jgi:anti-anti-sigma factor
MLADALAMVPDNEPGDITIDLAGVSFIDAGALGCLAGFANKLEAHGARLSVVGASAWLRRAFDIVQLGGLLETPGPRRDDRRAE